MIKEVKSNQDLQDGLHSVVNCLRRFNAENRYSKQPPENETTQKTKAFGNQINQNLS